VGAGLADHRHRQQFPSSYHRHNWNCAVLGGRIEHMADNLNYAAMVADEPRHSRRNSVRHVDHRYPSFGGYTSDSLCGVFSFSDGDDNMSDEEIVKILGQLVDEASWRGKDMLVVVELKQWLAKQIEGDTDD